MAIDHGLNNSMAGDYSSVAYWYQHEPHQTLSPLPSAPLRRVNAATVNLVQWGLCLILTSALAAALYLLVA